MLRRCGVCTLPRVLTFCRRQYQSSSSENIARLEADVAALRATQSEILATLKEILQVMKAHQVGKQDASSLLTPREPVKPIYRPSSAIAMENELATIKMKEKLIAETIREVETLVRHQRAAGDGFRQTSLEAMEAMTMVLHDMEKQLTNYKMKQ